MAPGKSRRLGRGLEALLSAQPLARASEAVESVSTVAGSGLRQIPIAQIRPNRHQPRRDFADSDLRDLETSIRMNGLLQPISVRTSDQGFELIAGERRFRAVQRLGWSVIPAIVRGDDEVSDKALLTLALVENLQRTDLNPIEEADGYSSLISQFSLTQQEVADVVGKDRSTVANTLRLLALPAAIRRMVSEGALTTGHARALLALGDDYRMVELAKVVIAEGLNVREAERHVREMKAPRTSASKERVSGLRQSVELVQVEEQLRRYLQTDVRIHLSSKAKGEVRIAFYSADDLERLLGLLLGSTRNAI